MTCKMLVVGKFLEEEQLSASLRPSMHLLDNHTSRWVKVRVLVKKKKRSFENCMSRYKRASNHKLQITNHKSQITNQKVRGSYETKMLSMQIIIETF